VEIQAVRGFKDILPGETASWDYVESVARGVFQSAGMKEIRIPVLEKTQVFSRGIGEHTDIVEKEMYTFTDRNGDSLSLRPEATAGLLRAVLEHKLYGRSPVLKLFTIGPMFRHERPQKGRLRQFHQLNVEVLGTDGPLADAEVIWLAWEILEELDVTGLRLEVNSLGCPTCRPAHKEDLRLYLEGVAADLCPDCRRRCGTNPLRVFDCKQEGCRERMRRAPLIKHYLCPGCVEHEKSVLDCLAGFGIPCTVNPYLVRGLDYYVRTTFELISPDLGAQGTVAAGGRYDGLVKAMGGPDLPGVGMAIGADRLMMLLPGVIEAEGTDLFVAALGGRARQAVIPWIKAWRRDGLIVEISYEDKALKAQLKQADRTGAGWCLLVGDQELDGGEVVLRNMKTQAQHGVPLRDVVSAVQDLMGEER